MLGVHQPDFAGRHSEERRVESGDVVDEAGSTVTILPGAPVPGRRSRRVSSGFRHVGHCVAALEQNVPVLVGVRSTRESCCVATIAKRGADSIG